MGGGQPSGNVIIIGSILFSISRRLASVLDTKKSWCVIRQSHPAPSLTLTGYKETHAALCSDTYTEDERSTPWACGARVHTDAPPEAQCSVPLLWVVGAGTLQIR